MAKRKAEHPPLPGKDINPSHDRDEKKAPRLTLKHRPEKVETHSGESTFEQAVLKLLSAAIYAGLGGNATIQESGAGEVTVFMPDVHWKIKVEDGRVNLVGQQKNPNLSQYLGKITEENTEAAINKVAENAVQLIQENSLKEEVDPVNFEGATPGNPQMPAGGPESLQQPPQPGNDQILPPDGGLGMPTDPAMGGMPPMGAPPVDPMAGGMGAAPPMDPAMGGMPPMGAPAGMPPAQPGMPQPGAMPTAALRSRRIARLLEAFTEPVLLSRSVTGSTQRDHTQDSYIGPVASGKRGNVMRRRAETLPAVVPGDPFGDKGEDGKYSTSDLEQTGHEKAIDDYQQVTATLKAVSAAVLKAGNRPVARRIAAIASQISAGGGNFSNPDAKLFSTIGLSFDEDATALDDDQQGGVLEFYGADAPKKDATGPQPRGASKKASAEDKKETKEEAKTSAKEKACDTASEKCASPKTSASKRASSVVQELESACNDGGGSLMDVLYEHQSDCEWLKQAMVYLEMQGLYAEKEEAEKLCEAAEGKTAKKASRVATVTSEKTISPWSAFKAMLRKAATASGNWGQGGRETRVADYGKAMELQINTHQADGATLVAKTLTFSLLGEDKKSKTATIEVNDPVLYHTVKAGRFSAPRAKAFAAEWAKNSQDVAKTILGES